MNPIISSRTGLPFAEAIERRPKAFTLFVSALLTFICLALSFCFSEAGHADEHGEEKRLVLWHSWRSEKQEILESIARDFNCLHDNFQITTEPLGPLSGSVAERMKLGLAGGDLPDIAIVERESIPSLANAGLIRPIEELLTEASGDLSKKNLLQPAYDYGAYEGKLYGIPISLNPYVLLYNPTLLQDMGLSEPPDDWTSLVSVADKLSKDTPYDQRQWALSVRSMAPIFFILCQQKGLDLFAANSGTERREILAEILDFIEGLRHRSSLLPPQRKFWDPNFHGVSGGRIYFQIDNTAMLALLLKGTSIPLEAAPVPSDSTPAEASLSGSPVFVIASHGDNGSSVTAFLEFFYSPECYSPFADELLFISPFKSVNRILQARISRRDLYQKLLTTAENARVSTLHPDTGLVAPELARIIDRLDAGLVSPEQALEEIIEVLKKKKPAHQASSRPKVNIAWAKSTWRLKAGETPALLPPPATITAARNEHESFQLLLFARDDLQDLTLEVAPFVSNMGNALGFEVTAYIEADTLISVPLVSESPGLFPNVLMPLAEFGVSQKTPARIWVDISISSDVAAGEYSSEIVVNQGSSRLAGIPIDINVLPLEIPETPSYPAPIGLNYDLISNYYNLKKKSDEYRRVMDSFYWFLAERRLAPFQPPFDISSDKITSYLEDSRVSACRLPFSPTDPRFQQAVSLAKKGGWLDKLFVHFIDEPTYHQYKAIIEAGARIDSMSDSPRFLVTCFPDKSLMGAVDIWCIHMRFLPEGIPRGTMEQKKFVDLVKQRNQSGDEIWWYTAGAVKPYPTLHIEDDPPSFRAIPWLQQMYQIDGFLHWEAANWAGDLEEPFVPFFGNGEGVLVYPGDMRPLPSIRLELLREGLEDMERLVLLGKQMEKTQKALNGAALGDVASIRIGEMCRRLIRDKALRAHAATGLVLAPHFEREPGHIERISEEVLQETISYAKRPYSLVLTEPEEKQYTDSDIVRIYGVVEIGSDVRINDRRVFVDDSGSFSAQFPLSTGSNVFSIQLENGENTKTFLRRVERL